VADSVSISVNPALDTAGERKDSGWARLRQGAPEPHIQFPEREYPMFLRAEKGKIVAGEEANLPHRIIISRQ